MSHRPKHVSIVEIVSQFGLLYYQPLITQNQQLVVYQQLPTPSFPPKNQTQDQAWGDAADSAWRLADSMLNLYTPQTRFTCRSSAMEQKVVAWWSWVHGALCFWIEFFVSQGTSFIGVRNSTSAWVVALVNLYDRRGAMCAVTTAHTLLSFLLLFGCEVDRLALVCIGVSFWGTTVEKCKFEGSKQETDLFKKQIKKCEHTGTWHFFSYFNWSNEELLLKRKRVFLNDRVFCVSLLIFLLKPY